MSWSWVVVILGTLWAVVVLAIITMLVYLARKDM